MPETIECMACNNAADYIVHGQWTIFDYLDLPCCNEHLIGAVRELQFKRIDGQEVLELWIEKIQPAVQRF